MSQIDYSLAQMARGTYTRIELANLDVAMHEMLECMSSLTQTSLGKIHKIVTELSKYNPYNLTLNRMSPSVPNL